MEEPVPLTVLPKAIPSEVNVTSYAPHANVLPVVIAPVPALKTLGPAVTVVAELNVKLALLVVIFAAKLMELPVMAVAPTALVPPMAAPIVTAPE